MDLYIYSLRKPRADKDYQATSKKLRKFLGFCVFFTNIEKGKLWH